MIARLGTARTRTALLLASLALVALVLDVWQYAAARASGQSAFDHAVSTASLPLERALLGVTRELGLAWQSVARGRALADENARLSAQAAALEDRLLKLQEGSAQSERERALLAAYSDFPEAHCLAHVTAVGSGGWLSYLLVDRGAEDGVQQGDVAVTREGVLGQVYAVTGHTARIVPLTDPASGVAVRIRRSRETGILKGLGEWRCEVRYLDPESAVRVGDQVLTAGTGGVFPKGLRVGTVIAVRADPHSPGIVAEVEAAADFRNAEEVLLLRSRP